MNTNHRLSSSLSHSLLCFPIALSPIGFYRTLWLSCLTVALLAFCAPARSMDISYTDTPAPALLMRGEIVPGDYANLLKFAVEHHIDLANRLFLLASPGGDVSEALRIGQLIKSLYATVAVLPRYGPCASACFIIYVSAVRRMSADRMLGIHRPYMHPDRLRGLSPKAVEALQTRAWLDAETYLHALRVPPSIVEEMFDNASTDIHWLTGNEITQLGLFAPWFEEFLIARCNLDKGAYYRSLRGVHLSIEEEASQSATGDCALRLTHPEALKAFNCAVGQETARARCE
jgi:ATP-dependent protease ClpP protease subunit